MGLGERGCIPDAAQLGTDALADGSVGSVVDGVCSQVELAALPNSGAEHRAASRPQSGVILGDDKLDAAHAARNEAVEETVPVDLGL